MISSGLSWSGARTRSESELEVQAIETLYHVASLHASLSEDATRPATGQDKQHLC